MDHPVFQSRHDHAVRLPFRREKGAVLFVALAILVLLTLLALSAAQVTGLQEQMSRGYRADNLAFQESERALRRAEQVILVTETVDLCHMPLERELPSSWYDGSTNYAAELESIRYENLSSANGMQALLGSDEAGLDLTRGSPRCLVIRVSATQPDQTDEPTSRAIVQSVYLP